MPRLEFHHIAWSKSRPPLCRHDLADSAVAPPDLEALGLPHGAELPRQGYREALPALESALGARCRAPGGRVLVAAGASEANACVFAGLLSTGDEVLVESPGYEPHRALASLFRIGLHRFSRDRGRDFAGFAGAVEAALTPSTRLVVVTQLHNPSGAALDPGDVEALDRLAERHGFLILCDETYGDAARLPLGTLASRGPRWIGTSSLTKSYGLGGLRIGWVAGSAEVLERAAAAQNGLSVLPALPSVALALALVPHLDALRARTHQILAENHARWSAAGERWRANGAGGGFDPGLTPLGTTAWCRFGRAGAGDAFAELAAERFGVAVTPGRFFGDPSGFRVGIGAEHHRFAEALEVLEAALEAFDPARAGTTGAPA